MKIIEWCDNCNNAGYQRNKDDTLEKCHICGGKQILETGETVNVTANVEKLMPRYAVIGFDVETKKPLYYFEETNDKDKALQRAGYWTSHINLMGNMRRKPLVNFVVMKVKTNGLIEEG